MTQCFDKDNPCGPGFKMDDDGQCQVTDDICGDKCYKLNAAQDNCIRIPNCGSLTGSDVGDMFLYLGESVVAGVIYDALGRRVMKVADRIIEKEAAKKAAIAAEKAAAQQAADAVAKGGAKASTKLATQTAQKRIAGEAAQIVARKGALQIATIAAKKLGAKIALQLAKIAALSSTGVGILATPLMILSTSLTIGLTAAGVFFEVPPGYSNVQDYETLPEAGRTALEAIPVLGDLVSMIFPYVFFTTSCGKGLEESNSLCYPPAEDDFQCEAFLCYAKADRLVGYNANNYMGGTKQHLTKKIITDSGKIPNTCPAGMIHGIESTDAAPGFCYDKPGGRSGKIIAGTFWEDCQPGERDDLAFCAKEAIDPCPAGSDDIAGTCWGNTGEVCADNCAAGWDGCKRRSWNAAKCKRGSDKCSWGCYQDNPFGRCGGCEKRIWTCDEYGDWDCIGGCVTTCSPVRGITKELIHRNFRFESRPKYSAVLTPHENICAAPNSHKWGALCYPNDQEMPQGYHRKAYGTLDPGCPGDKDSWRGLQMFNPTQDIGVSCQLATYTRPPFPKISMLPKRRVVIEDPPLPQLPPLCSTLPLLQPDHKDYNQRLCRESDPPSGFDLSEDGLVFFKKCRDLFKFNIGNGRCETVDDNGVPQSYENLEGLIQVEYDFK
jgi:hypothetical protein